MASAAGILNFTLADLTTANPAMQRCLSLAREGAKSELPLLLQGETGTGKTLLAQAIHHSSSRSTATFVSFNASAMSDTLLESQLFGHEKGAFTGATARMRGKFETADEGTIFFDEIADMSSLAQAKILRAVEYGEFERLGAEAMRHADVRVISATNQSLRKLAASGDFRTDLYHRLNGITLHIPPLRDRSEDLPALIAFELRQCAAQASKTITGIHPDAFTRLLAHDWPGNLRELHRVVQALVLFTDTETVLPDAVLLDEPVVNSETPEIAEIASAPSSRKPATGDLSLETAIHRHVLEVYEMAGRNKSKAAAMLVISRTRLDRKLMAAWDSLA
jgi:transcriptional regulator with PAS, ATPase and Fis domain